MGKSAKEFLDENQVGIWHDKSKGLRFTIKGTKGTFSLAELLEMFKRVSVII